MAKQRDPRAQVLGKRLRQARTSKGLTQKELGYLVSVDSTTISSQEIGTNTLSLETLRSICEVLQLEVEQLLEDVGYDPGKYRSRKQVGPMTSKENQDELFGRSFTFDEVIFMTTNSFINLMANNPDRITDASLQAFADRILAKFKVPTEDYAMTRETFERIQLLTDLIKKRIELFKDMTERHMETEAKIRRHIERFREIDRELRDRLMETDETLTDRIQSTQKELSRMAYMVAQNLELREEVADLRNRLERLEATHQGQPDS